eukprot:5199739-Pyramimonas_sp.AAC.3
MRIAGRTSHSPSHGSVVWFSFGWGPGPWVCDVPLCATSLSYFPLRPWLSGVGGVSFKDDPRRHLESFGEEVSSGGVRALQAGA